MDQIDPTAPPSGTGCADCEATGAWWLHLRQLAAPDSHPAAQPVPGPAGRVPADWTRHLH